jgi:UDP-glucose 4-epimerase
MRLYRNNTAATRSLIESAVACGVANFVLTSSTAVYGKPGPAPVAEVTEPRPQGIFARSIHMAEEILADTARVHALNCCIMRSGIVVGADPASRAGPHDGSGGGTIGAALDVIFGLRDSVTIGVCPGATPDGTAMRDYVHVSDLAAANVAALERMLAGDANHLLFNCGYGNGYSDKAVIGALGRISNMVIKHRGIPLTATEPPVMVADNSAILTGLDWAPQRADLETLIRDTLRWELQEPRSSKIGRETERERAVTRAPWIDSQQPPAGTSQPALPLPCENPDRPGREREQRPERVVHAAGEFAVRQSQ